MINSKRLEITYCSQFHVPVNHVCSVLSFLKKLITSKPVIFLWQIHIEQTFTDSGSLVGDDVSVQECQILLRQCTNQSTDFPRNVESACWLCGYLSWQIAQKIASNLFLPWVASVCVAAQERAFWGCVNWKENILTELLILKETCVSTYTAGSPWTCIGVGWVIPLFLSVFITARGNFISCGSKNNKKG